MGDDPTRVVGRWQFAGLGYLTGGDAEPALASAPEPANGGTPPTTTELTERRTTMITRHDLVAFVAQLTAEAA